MVNIKLMSMDCRVFDVDRDVLRLSSTLNNMFRDLGMLNSDADMPTDPIPLNNISGSILKKVIEWCTYHRNDPPIVEDKERFEPLPTEISAWDAEFLKVDQGTLFELMLAANYLEVRGLLNVACNTIANMIKGKSANDIRLLFNIQNDFSAEEVDEMRKENPFLGD